MSSNNIYCVQVFLPVGTLQKNFKLSFVPTIREESLATGRTSILVDVQVGHDTQKPFIVSDDTEKFCLSSHDHTFFFRKVPCETPSYEVSLGHRFVWVNRLGNQGLNLLMQEYFAAKKKSG